MNKPLNINDIANLAGVAKSTVSRFLNGGSVSEKTKLKIEQIIKKTGFLPNQSAQNLKSKHSKLVGVVIPRIDSYAVSRTLMGLDSILSEFDMQMLVLNSSQSIQREINALDNLSKQKLAGVVWLASKFTSEHNKVIKQLQLANIPILIVGQTHPTLPFIAYPDYEAASTLAKYCISLGHDNAAYIGVAESDLAVGKNRWQGYLDVFKSNHANLTRYLCSFSMDDAYQITKSILADKKTYSLILCATDNIALGAFKALAEAGISIPDEISLAGFGGYQFSEMLHPAITTISLPFYEAGQIAAYKLKLMNQIMLNEDASVKQLCIEQFNSSSSANCLKRIDATHYQNRLTLDSDHIFTDFHLKKHQSVDLKS
ncbi:LacI family DNA-binding transcriptional regulator [Thorsellia anophelis]|uniref:LacI family transcriptional regulator, sucrose operon repressor n=1 Tax=Thorsellia anophelis DSM 18579 TaxID=1123402 RepID=A0A1H9YTZ1_9GAMM|nr:LacI family DNA-binding transcriptional regulator [Thorsellia anophelis]SES72632.1 LacI family transcriptional regulator, sucrose operon repressor [Thorsellia anophelis DSM 18579]